MHKRFREQVVFIPFPYFLTLGSLSNRDNDENLKLTHRKAQIRESLHQYGSVVCLCVPKAFYARFPVSVKSHPPPFSLPPYPAYPQPLWTPATQASG